MQAFFENSVRGRKSFTYPVISNAPTSSIFSQNFDMNQLVPMPPNVSTGSIGVDFYNNQIKVTSAVIQVRTDMKSSCIDVDVYIREFLSKKYMPFKDTDFHNIPFDEALKGFKVGFEHSGTVCCSELTPEQVKNMIQSAGVNI